MIWIFFLINFFIAFILLRFFLLTLLGNSISINILANLTINNKLHLYLNSNNNIKFRVTKLKKLGVIASVNSDLHIVEKFNLLIRFIIILQLLLHSGNAKLRMTMKKVNSVDD